ncbi:MAG: hypothetical protein WAZ94_15025 [Phycisphaerales bacterium]|nr:hypothetical protein [Chloroflexota bacterium]
MRFALLLLLAGCGVVEEVREELPSVAVTPAGPEVLPPGWYLHLYPAQCIVLVRDEEGTARRCMEERVRCTPTDPRWCAGTFPGVPR